MDKFTQETVALAKKEFAKESRARKALNRVEGSLRQVAHLHNEKREEALEEAMRLNGRAWCTLGEHEAPLDQIKHVLFRHREMRGWGQYDTWQAEVEYQDIHVACKKCLKKSERPYIAISNDYYFADHRACNQDHRFDDIPEKIYEKYGAPPKATVRRDGREVYDYETRGYEKLYIGDDPIELGEAK